MKKKERLFVAPLTSFDAAFERLLLLEGGFSDDPSDRGGRTKYGITEGVWRSSGSTVDISEITESDARSFYFERYWCDGGLGILEAAGVPSRLLSEIFCGVVHCGVSKGIRLLQLGYNEVRESGTLALVVDGVVGAKTSRALGDFCGKYSDTLVAVYRVYLGIHYLTLVGQNPSQRRFIRGWMRRLV